MWLVEQILVKERRNLKKSYILKHQKPSKTSYIMKPKEVCEHRFNHSITKLTNRKNEETATT